MVATDNSITPVHRLIKVFSLLVFQFIAIIYVVLITYKINDHLMTYTGSAKVYPVYK